MFSYEQVNADVELMVRIGSAALNAAQSLSILTGAPVDDAMLLSAGAKLFPDVGNGAYSPRERDLSCVSLARWIQNGLPVVEMGRLINERGGAGCWMASEPARTTRDSPRRRPRIMRIVRAARKIKNLSRVLRKDLSYLHE